MGCYGLTDDLRDEINDLERKNKKLLNVVNLLEQDLNRTDKELVKIRNRISKCFTTINQLNKRI